jgi:glyoxylase-like metal-dependent hydrolase (beta-lactamase superfamily II)
MRDASPYPPDGHVEPGGPAAVGTLQVDGVDVEIRKLSVSAMDNNVYVLTDLGRGEALLIDAADDAPRLLDELGDRRLAAIFTTHGHWDHVRALDDVARATGAPVILHPGDAQRAGRQPDQPAEDGMRLAFGDAAVELRHTPGHTRGSTCAVLGGTHLFSGDTLFPGGPGATFGDADAFATIMDSLRTKLFTLADHTWVYPGHGDDTTLGVERPHLDEWQARGW